MKKTDKSTAKPEHSVEIEKIFNSLNSAYIVFAADDPTFTIIQENDAHAKVAMVKRADTIGKPLLEAFPDTSELYVKTGKSELLESIRRAIATGKPDAMPTLKYDLKAPNGMMTEMFWSVTHHPVFGKDKKVHAVYQETRDITAEVLAEKKVDTIERQLQQVLGTSMVGTWSWDIKAEKVYADANLATMFGIDQSAVKAGLPLQRFIDSIHNDDRDRVMKKIEHTLATKEPYEVEYRTAANNGSSRWVLARGHVQYDDTDMPSLFLGAIIDITVQKTAEQSAKESEQRLIFMADSMPQLVWITRPDGFHEYYNKQWYAYTGTNDGETDGEGWNSLFHPDDQERAQKLWQHCLKTGEPYEIEYRLYNAPSKNYRWVIGRALPFKDENGTILKWYGTCTDIDEQKRSEELQTFLSHASKELSSTLNYKAMLTKITEICIPGLADWCSIDLYDDEAKVIDQVAIAHKDADKLSMVKDYRRLYPAQLDAPTGVPAVIRTGKHEYYPVITIEMIEQAVSDTETLEFMRKLDLHSLVVAPLSINGKVCGGISFASSDSGRYYNDQDLQMMLELAARISLAMTNSSLYNKSKEENKQRKKLEEQLRIEKHSLEDRVHERTEQLEETNIGLRSEIKKRHAAEKILKEYSESLARSNRELEDFAYVASHDLQEPLRKIQAFGNLLESEYKEKLKGDGLEYLKRMHAAASRMSTLIEDLLAFSRVTTRQNPPESVGLNKIVSEVLSDLETRTQEVGATMTVGKLGTIVADPTHMRQLFQNLIGNALKFHRPDVPPVVNVSATTEDGVVEIKVSDNGIGFDEKYVDRIFSVFQRLHDRSSYEGTGIGLAVCRKIAERYNGTIKATSKKGEGSTFIVRIPKEPQGEAKK
jgi:PAS domain S-box-containing protein